ncbi:DUF1345 domain-containing protein [Micromonospora sp. NPDC000018]|uniref:DUF1345 domain-containing protein n=1 Tax=Micromonospora sp. NPDC000018 TaxID=3154239 RepID=UPI0033284FA3
MWVLGFIVVAPLIAWDVAALVYVAWSFLDLWYMDAEATAASAVREDPGRRVTDTVLLAASLVAVAKVLPTRRAAPRTGHRLTAQPHLVRRWVRRLPDVQGTLEPDHQRPARGQRPHPPPTPPNTSPIRADVERQSPQRSSGCGAREGSSSSGSCPSHPRSV